MILSTLIEKITERGEISADKVKKHLTKLRKKKIKKIKSGNSSENLATAPKISDRLRINWLHLIPNATLVLGCVARCRIRILIGKCAEKLITNKNFKKKLFGKNPLDGVFYFQLSQFPQNK